MYGRTNIVRDPRFAAHPQSPQLWTDRGARQHLTVRTGARRARRKQLNHRHLPAAGTPSAPLAPDLLRDGHPREVTDG